MRSILCVIALAVLAAVPVFPQAQLNRRVTNVAPLDYEAIRLARNAVAVRITEEITIDGHLDEPAWQLATPLSDFIQRVPDTGAPATERSEVRILYDDENLYAGFFSFDRDVKHMGVNELKEDFGFGENDSSSIVIDSMHDRRSGFLFVTNPEGARRDGQVSNDGQLNVDWDGVWDVKVSRNDEGWIAEFVIPFKTLRFSNSPSQEWGLNMSRRVNRANEESYWSPMPMRYTATRVSQAGTLRGLENIHQGRNLKVKPFVTAGVTQVRNGTRMDTLRSLSRFKDYDGGVDAKYSLTPQLTLDATYRTDFAQVEVDQQQVNLTRFNLFFPEKRDFFLENAGTFSFGPGGNLVPFFSRTIGLSGGNPVPILGGARVTGKVAQYDVGFLSMKTDKLQVTPISAIPSNNYLVGRVKRNLFRNSWIGSLVTSRDSTAGGDYNRVYGADAHFQFYSKLDIDSYILGSTTPGRSGQNQARRLQTGWRDEEWTAGAEYNGVQANFNPEVGFIRRGDMNQYSVDMAWKPLLRNSDTIRSLNFATNLDYFGGSASGKVETRTQDMTLGITLEDTSSISFNTNQTFDRLLTPFRIRSNASIPAGDYSYLGYTGSFTTNAARRISGNASLNWGEFWNGHRNSFSSGLGVKPNHHLNVDLSYSRNRVNLPIANGTFTTALFGARFLYGFTPRAFVNAFFQYNADTHQVSSNIRFSITHHPLSDLYLVYNDTRNTTTHEVVGRAFIIKLTNLFNF